MKNCYLLGIGGAGMTALAQFLSQKGIGVAGYDMAESHNTQLLAKQNIPVHFSADVRHLQQADACIYSAAIPPSHPLLTYAKGKIPTFSRGEAMGGISQGFNTVVGVAGTHGKTTCSAMLTHILHAAGKNPSALLGGTLIQTQTNGIAKGDRLLICEACEYAESFLHLKRDIGVVLNIDNDHLEYYGDMQGLTNSFKQFLYPCKTQILNGDDALVTGCQNHSGSAVTFGLGHHCHYRARDITEEKGMVSFTMTCHSQPLCYIHLTVPGKHNLYNALAAGAAAHCLGVASQHIQEGLNTFPGTKRRFERVYRDQTVTVVDDYAHHPAEIQAVLTTARSMGYDYITVIFQPFTYSRTKALTHEFAQALSLADRVILPPIMAGRESHDPTISSGHLAEKIPGSILCENLSHAAATVLAHPVAGELVLTLGCGNVYRCARMMADKLEKRQG